MRFFSKPLWTIIVMSCMSSFHTVLWQSQLGDKRSIWPVTACYSHLQVSAFGDPVRSRPTKRNAECFCACVRVCVCVCELFQLEVCYLLLAYSSSHRVVSMLVCRYCYPRRRTPVCLLRLHRRYPRHVDLTVFPALGLKSVDLMWFERTNLLR